MNTFKTVVVNHPMGLQMRVAAELVQLVSQFKSHIVVWKDQINVNGKSLIGLMSLGACKGTQLKFVLEGEDADEALETIFRFLESGQRVERSTFFKVNKA
jgi:phosphotransferase system HPr (HPr) family protein